MPTPTFNVLLRRMETIPSSSKASAADAASTIAPFATALNGVNQGRNELFMTILWGSLGVLTAALFITRFAERASKHYRHLAAMFLPAANQKYWSKNTTSWWKFKKHIIYAPLWNKRHNREIQLSGVVNIGTLPSRLHSIMLSLYILSNIIACVVMDYRKRNKYEVVAELRGRSGYLSLINMIPLIILAGRNNPLISWLQISFDTYNLIHRSMGRIVVWEAVVHTLAWGYVKFAATGWSGIGKMVKEDPFIGWGTVGTVALIIIFLHSPSPIRHAFYETFLVCHIFLAATIFIATYIHVRLAGLHNVAAYVVVVAGLWVGDRLWRFGRLVYFNYSKGKFTDATVVALPGEATRVTLHLPRYAEIKPGTHAYLRFALLNAWESHPFSIAWVEHNSVYVPKSEKLAEDNKQILDKEKSTTDVSFVIHAHTGLTKRLYDRAAALGPSRNLTIRAALEGPYGGHHSLDSYGHAVLFAGSSGISHQIPYVRRLIEGYGDETVATRRVTLVWIIREPEHLEWVRPWMDAILRMPNRRSILHVKVYITRPKSPRAIHSASEKVQMFAGRPNIPLLLEQEVSQQVGAMAVTVCGPGGLADNIRDAVRKVQDQGVIDFVEESFTW